MAGCAGFCPSASSGRRKANACWISRTCWQYRRGLLLIVMPPADPEAALPVLAALGHDTWLAASMLYTGEDRRQLRDLSRSPRARGCR